MKLTLKQFVYAALIIGLTLFSAAGMALYTTGHQSVALGLAVFLAVLIAFCLAIAGNPNKRLTDEA